MPELPEVETVRKGLVATVSGKNIQAVSVLWDKIVNRPDGEDLQEWEQSLVGQQIQTVHRRGKYLIFELDDSYLVSHLRMEGKYFYQARNSEEWNDKLDKHVHLIFTFTDGSRLLYHDVRKFGRIERVAKDELGSYFVQKKLGPEPTRDQFKLAMFRTELATIKRPIKPTLLDQSLVVGLGNIYVDESLFRAGIHPLRTCASLEVDEVEALYEAVIEVLDQAVKLGGSSIRTYRNTLGQAGEFQLSLCVYGRQGQDCLRCGHKIEKMKVQQRGTHYCPQCQPLN
ncbi:DNA-formamidopyrimidine glycosylase [Vaginisenegalia massiliensis]|uniref:DNA-formamidopyrimidine glycosylase n=1 Tax=Vaginisenegalia massiliensis TaxID=2058294 RepID=UPI000F51F183|nr:DNA-formamidopyrimidine glycosylase [Vaginisenegalia massiliensis]